MSVLTPNWNNTFAWTQESGDCCDVWNGTFAEYTIPMPAVSDIAALTAEEMQVVPLTAPPGNSSYEQRFFGPTLSCSKPDELQRRAYGYYQDWMMSQSIFTASGVYSQSWNTSGMVDGGIQIISPGQLLWSGMIVGSGKALAYPQLGIVPDPPTPQLWVQLANESIICRSVNARFHISVDSFSGSQVVTQHEIEILDNYDYWESSPYTAAFFALALVLNGNSTIQSLRGGESSLSQIKNGVMSTGLIGCNELAHNYWENCTINYPVYGNYCGLDSVLLPSEPWMCRNRSITSGIEDLANNFTISLLSASTLT